MASIASASTSAPSSPSKRARSSSPSSVKPEKRQRLIHPAQPSDVPDSPQHAAIPSPKLAALGSPSTVDLPSWMSKDTSLAAIAASTEFPAQIAPLKLRTDRRLHQESSPQETPLVSPASLTSRLTSIKDHRGSLRRVAGSYTHPNSSQSPDRSRTSDETVKTSTLNFTAPSASQLSHTPASVTVSLPSSSQSSPASTPLSLVLPILPSSPTTVAFEDRRPVGHEPGEDEEVTKIREENDDIVVSASYQEYLKLVDNDAIHQATRDDKPGDGLLSRADATDKAGVPVPDGVIDQAQAAMDGELESNGDDDDTSDDVEVNQIETDIHSIANNESGRDEEDGDDDPWPDSYDETFDYGFDYGFRGSDSDGSEPASRGENSIAGVKVESSYGSGDEAYDNEYEEEYDAVMDDVVVDGDDHAGADEHEHLSNEAIERDIYLLYYGEEPPSSSYPETAGSAEVEDDDDFPFDNDDDVYHPDEVGATSSSDLEYEEVDIDAGGDGSEVDALNEGVDVLSGVVTENDVAEHQDVAVAGETEAVAHSDDLGGDFYREGSVAAIGMGPVHVAIVLTQ